MDLSGLVFNRMTLNRLEVLEKTQPHSIVFLGSKGCGKYTVARKLCAEYLGISESKLVQHPDFYEMKDEGCKVLKKESVEELLELSHIKPVVASKRVFLIDNASDLNMYAQNALLKKLEDGESDSCVVFIAHSPLLLTIMSRCEVLRFPDLSLENFGKDVNPLVYYASRGNVGVYNTYMESKEFVELIEKSMACIQDRKELLLVMGAVKEKDKNYFYSWASGREVMGFLNCLIAGFSYVCREGVLPEYFKGFCNYTFEQANSMYNLVSSLFVKLELGKFTKNDFFDLLIMLTKGGALV